MFINQDLTCGTCGKYFCSLCFQNLIQFGTTRLKSVFINSLNKVTELLSEVQPKKDRNKALDDVLHELNTLLLSLPDRKKEQQVTCKALLDGSCIALADTCISW